LAVLTDGREWHFFLPGEQGDYGERRVYKLDIVEREPDESVRRFERYLKYEAVCSGAALAAARSDYQDVARERQVLAKLPEAWTKLVEEEDELLLELLADRVESLCGYKPDPDTVARFLSENVALRTTPQPPPVVVPPKRPEPMPIPPIRPPGPATFGFLLSGVLHNARNARDVLVCVIEALAERDSTFLDRFASLPKHGRTRRYIARDQNDLYPGRPDLAQEFSHQLRSGWWLGINISRKQVERIIQMACEVAGLRYGRDLTVTLGS
jgi:hypothetical protein